MNSLVREYAREWARTNARHGQAVADGISRPDAASAGTACRAPGTALSPPGAVPDVSLADVHAMDVAEWEAGVEQWERLFTCRWDGD